MAYIESIMIMSDLWKFKVKVNNGKALQYQIKDKYNYM